MSLIELNASEIAEKVKTGQINATEVVEEHIQRIEEVNPKINALVIPLFDEARAQAKELDKKYRNGETGLLHGVPVTIKEQYKVSGTQVTLGALNKVGNVYKDEGSIVRKLRDEGAVILGKTNIIQTLSGFESDNRVYGRSNNPWNLERTPGGSSGGEGAMVAVGGSALGMAGDFAGSTRIPAHFCGVHGLKPTTGRLTNDDFPADLLGYGQEAVIPQPGPIARSVRDLSLAMEVMTQTSMSYTIDLVPPVPWRDPENVNVDELNIGFYDDNGFFPASPALRRAVRESVKAVESMGANVLPITPPDPKEAIRIFMGAVSAGGTDDFKRLLGNEKPIPQIAPMLKGFSVPAPVIPLVKKIMKARGQNYLAFQLECVGKSSARDYWEIVEARSRYRANFLKMMDERGIDAILCPPFPLPAITHGSSEHLFPAMSYTLVYNVIGAPAGVVSVTKVKHGEESDRDASRDKPDIVAKEVEMGSAGLPVGVQVVSAHWREDIVLAVMEALENHFRKKSDYPVTPYMVGG